MNMRRTTGQLKAEAREQLKGKYTVVIVAYLVIAAVAGIINALTTVLFGSDTVFSFIMSQFFSLVVSLITSVITVGMYKIFLDISRGKEGKIGDVFCMFQHHPDRVILVSLVLTVIQMIFMIPSLVSDYHTLNVDYPQQEQTWRIMLMFLLLLAGIIISTVVTLPFSFSYFLLIDDEEMDAVEALKQSRQLMRGNYGRYIYMLLSFVGLYMLGIISCGIGLLWVMPYATMTGVEFYRDVQGELDHKQEQDSENKDKQEEWHSGNPDDIYHYGGEA